MGKQYVFGSGSLFAYNTTTANSTPEQFAALQNVSLDFQFNLKELYGQNNFPLTVARAAGKITGKAMNASFQARQFNDIFFGGTLASGQLNTALNETGTIPGTPYQITAANTATFVTDLGVTNAATGLQFVKVASGPATGQYSVSAAGVYTFAAADTTVAVKLNYTYTTAGSGQKITVSQALMGVAPNFAMTLNSVYNGQQFTVVLNACVANKLAIATKTEDFTVPDFEFQAFADASGTIGTLSFANAGD